MKNSNDAFFIQEICWYLGFFKPHTDQCNEWIIFKFHMNHLSYCLDNDFKKPRRWHVSNILIYPLNILFFQIWYQQTAGFTPVFLLHIPIYIYIYIWRYPLCNGYRRRKWTRRHEFKSWTRLIAFHIALIPLGKVWIQIFPLQLWVNSRAD